MDKILFILSLELVVSSKGVFVVLVANYAAMLKLQSLNFSCDGLRRTILIRYFYLAVHNKYHDNKIL